MAKRPDLPKRLAARIRGAQEKVRQARLDVMAREHNRASSQKWVDEFDADPAAFAARHYRSHDVSSYPVQTTIGRAREKLEYYERKNGAKEAALEEACANLVAIEKAVLEEVALMRATAGRVPWPRDLPSFKAYREAEAAQARRDEERSRREHEKWEAEEAVREKVRAAEREIETEREVEDYRRMFALLPPEVQAEQRRKSDWLLEKMRSGEIKPLDVVLGLMKQTAENKRS